MQPVVDRMSQEALQERNNLPSSVSLNSNTSKYAYATDCLSQLYFARITGLQKQVVSANANTNTPAIYLKQGKICSNKPSKCLQSRGRGTNMLRKRF